jgi:uncharacterized repeat protein (TIGR01451 family)
VPGSAYVRYAPNGSVTPTTPLVRILQGTSVTNVLTSQDLLTQNGLNITVPGIASIAVGEKPRPIGSDNMASPPSAPAAADGTSASGAVDVVRVKVLANPEAGIQALDLRIGHMEAKAQVPAGGFTCPIPVNKDANPREVNPGQRFTYTITVDNPFDCTLDPVKVVDSIKVDPGISYSILGSNPAASSQDASSLTFNNIGPIGPHTSKTISIDVQVNEGSRAGLFTDNAKASATCATGAGEGLARISVPVSGEVTVQLPRVAGVAAQLAATGPRGWWLPVGGAALVAGLAGIVAFRRLRLHGTS